MGSVTSSPEGYSVGSLVCQNDTKIREGESPYQTGSDRRLNIENSGEIIHFNGSHHYYSQTQITVDGSVWKLAASTLNQGTLLRGRFNRLLSSVSWGTQSEIFITSPS